MAICYSFNNWTDLDEIWSWNYVKTTHVVFKFRTGEAKGKCRYGCSRKVGVRLQRGAQRRAGGARQQHRVRQHEHAALAAAAPVACAPRADRADRAITARALYTAKNQRCADQATDVINMKL